MVTAFVVPAASPGQTATDSLPLLGSIQSDGAHFLRSSVRVFTAPLRWGRAEWTGLGLAAATIGVSSLLDGDVRAAMERSQSTGLDRAARRVEVLGTVTNYRALTALYLGGLVAGDAHARETAAEALASSTIAGALITPITQTVTGRFRPRAGHDVYTFRAFGGGHSFPSGHTTQAFAVASVLALEYPKPAVKVLAYGTAAAVGASRMYHGAHFLSDVVAGALLGHAVARAASGTARRLEVSPGSDGFGVRIRF